MRLQGRTMALRHRVTLGQKRILSARRGGLQGPIILGIFALFWQDALDTRRFLVLNYRDQFKIAGQILVGHHPILSEEVA